MAEVHAAQGQQQRRSVRVAIVGSGLTGLSAAYFLTNELRSAASSSEPPVDVEVELFERAPRLGMDASSISVTDPCSQKSLRIDVPMRAFNAGYYPELLALYRRLNIARRPSNFSYSFASVAAASSVSRSESNSTTLRVPSPSFIYLGSSGAKGTRMPSILRRAIPTFRMLDARRAWAALCSITAYWTRLLLYILGYLHFLVLCLYHSWLGHTRDPAHPIATLTLAEWSRANWVSSYFMDDILVPILSASQTATDTAIWQTPCAEVLEFTALMFGENTFLVATGIHTVVTALTSRMGPNALHLSSTILEMRPSPTKPGAVLFRVAQAEEDGEGQGQQQDTVVREFDGYDYVIFGLQANQTAQILRAYEKLLTADRSTTFDATQQKHRSHLRETIHQLEQFPYERSVVINHTDTRMLPPEQDRCDLNMISPAPRGSQSRFPSQPHQNGDAGLGLGSDEEEDEGAVDRLLRDPSNGLGAIAKGQSSSSNGMNGNESGQTTPSHDAYLLAPEGCTMVTHLIKHYTRPIASPSSSTPSSSDPDSGAASRFPDLPLLAHGRQGAVNGHAQQDREHAAARSVDDVHDEPGAASNGAASHPNGTVVSTSNGSAATEEGEGESVLFMQTTNPMAPYLPRPELILSISHFERVVPTVRAKAAQGHFFKWAKVGNSQKTTTTITRSRQRSKGDNKTDAGRFIFPTMGRYLSALLPPAPRSQWKVELGDLQRQDDEPAEDRGPGLLVAGSWGPPAIPLLEGCVTSARLAVSELLRREGTYSVVCEELAASAL
ncbi:unnamed protein product [Tilletia laevis]|uniref:Amine oxidase domain-containing protein n=3 Tax=Tilletia TaxID=13289 RepID=A0A8X7MPB5_9BASI|nr:hypothetical protein CF336_g8470 [Tilletia laevis]KAE8192249.1 hypothetical protein CF328_g5431 [Tilletia controversa]KAE8241900.1 hypothetical protein A4X03_0g8065 [Tilletia caries]KAE8243509.1 hypothetical protein A4X06_0g6263 [Tilletia controversa]CAD6884592.1 unnamed protein product [Tilletia caries]